MAGGGSGAEMGATGPGHAVSSTIASADDVVLDAAARDALADLAVALDRQPTADEALAWTSMSKSNRDGALRRIDVLGRWTDAERRGTLVAADAAKLADLKLSRFYDLASKWRSGERTLFDVARFARSQSGRKGRFDPTLLNELQAAVVGVVRDHGKLPVAKQVELLAAAVEARGRSLPKTNSLRTIVERERRRVATRAQVGTQPGFDLTGTGLGRSDGGQHVLFGIIDRTSRLIMGLALGDPADSGLAYAAAAADARRWLRSADAEGLPWSPLTERIDVVPGDDLAWWRSVDRSDCPVEAVLADGKRSRGGYFRRFVGPYLGPLRLEAVGGAASRATSDGDVFDDELALLRVRVAVAAHNATVKAAMDGGGESGPAPTLDAALAWVEGLPR